MSDLAVDSSRSGDAGHRLIAPITVAVLVTLGIVCFVAMLVLGAYAPDLKRDGNGGGHALSASMNGFTGVVRLAEATGRRARIVRDIHLLRTEDLVVATPETGAVNIDPVIGQRASTPTLLVLPKWATRPYDKHRGWVTIDGLLPRGTAQGVLAPAAILDIVQRRSGGRPLTTVEPLMTGVAFDAPTPLQAIRPTPAGTKPKGDAGYGPLEPLIVDEAGNIVLGRFAARPLFVLADPDLLDNRGMHDARAAASALAMLDWMNSNQAEGIAFDVTLNGFAHGASPLKLMFEPPFLATTLTLAVVVLLGALGTVPRFGSARPRERAIAFGKTALVDNTAVLVGKARREVSVGQRYTDVVRDIAVRAFAVPMQQRGAALDAQLDRLDRGDQPFSALAQTLAHADDKTELVSAAGALHDWIRGRQR